MSRKYKKPIRDVSGVAVVSIPKAILEYEGLERDDVVEVSLRKVEKSDC